MPAPATTASATPISDSLARALDTVMRSVPPGKTGRVEGDVSLTGATLSVAAQLTPVWSVGAYGAYTWAGNRELGARAVAIW